MRSRPASRWPALVAALVLVALLSLAPAPAAYGQAGGDDTTTSTSVVPLPPGGIIPQPNSGHEPTEAGDRGGALQLAVFVGILAGVGVIGGLAWRESRKARRGSSDR